MEKYTRVPNILFDKWMAKMKATSFTVLMTIWRKTIGWDKEYDKISISQIMELTGLSNKTITEAIKELKLKKLIINENLSRKIGYFKVNLTTVNSTADENQSGVNSTDSTVNSTADMPKTDVNSTDTKEIFKETITKENSELHKWLINLFYVSYSLKYNETLIINGKEGKQIKEIIKIATKLNKENPKQEIQKKFDILKESTYLKLVPGILLSQWNSLVKDKKNETKSNEIPFGAIRKPSDNWKNMEIK
jgi:phage replication O-like protein O